MLKKISAWILLPIFILSSVTLGSPDAQANSPAVPGVARQELNQPVPSVPGTFQIPLELGRVQEQHLVSGVAPLILIQDAHSIPDAQRSIYRLIEYFQKSYGVRRVALEGASVKLDPQFLRSYPDQKLLKEILDEYFDRSELSGVSAAALMSPFPSIYQGVEDWALYEKGIGYFLEALGEENGLSIEHRAEGIALEKEKEKFYSKQLLQVDRLEQSFRENQQDLATILTALSRISAPRKGSSLESLVLEIKNTQKSGNSISIRKTASELETLLRRKNAKASLQKFHQKKQQFQTESISESQFAAALKDLAESEKITLHFPKKLKESAETHQKALQMEGSQLMKELDEYFSEIKSKLFRNSEERRLDQKTRELYLTQKLIRLELTREEWEELNGREDERTKRRNDAFLNHLAFYKNAENRENMMFKNLTSRRFVNSSFRPFVLVAGGFHTQGLAEKLKAQNLSYVVVTPHIKNIPEHSVYKSQMRGDVSWKSYFQPSNGQIDLYGAFVRAVRDTLVLSRESWVLGKKIARPTTQDTRLLKEWRDNIIIDLSAQKKIEDASSYTRFIDEIPAGSGFRVRELNPQWFSNVEAFFTGLRKLETTSQLSPHSIAALFKPSTAAVDMISAALASGQLSFVRSKLRKTPVRPVIITTSPFSRSELRGTLEHDPKISWIRGGKSRLSANSEDEQLSLVDSQGNWLRKWKEREVVHRDKDLHEVVHLYLMDWKGRVWFQRRSLKKKTSPGKIQIAVSGHVTFGQTPDQALVAEAWKEAGLRIDLNRVFEIAHYRNHDPNNPEWVRAYGYVLTQDVYSKLRNAYNTNEIQDFAGFQSYQSFMQHFNKTSEQFSNSLHDLMKHNPGMIEQIFAQAKTEEVVSLALKEKSGWEEKVGAILESVQENSLDQIRTIIFALKKKREKILNRKNTNRSNGNGDDADNLGKAADALTKLINAPLSFRETDFGMPGKAFHAVSRTVSNSLGWDRHKRNEIQELVSGLSADEAFRVIGGLERQLGVLERAAPNPSPKDLKTWGEYTYHLIRAEEAVRKVVDPRVRSEVRHVDVEQLKNLRRSGKALLVRLRQRLSDIGKPVSKVALRNLAKELGEEAKAVRKLALETVGAPDTTKALPRDRALKDLNEKVQKKLEGTSHVVLDISGRSGAGKTTISHFIGRGFAGLGKNQILVIPMDHMPPEVDLSNRIIKIREILHLPLKDIEDAQFHEILDIFQALDPSIRIARESPKSFLDYYQFYLYTQLQFSGHARQLYEEHFKRFPEDIQVANWKFDEVGDSINKHRLINLAAKIGMQEKLRETGKAFVQLYNDFRDDQMKDYFVTRGTETDTPQEIRLIVVEGAYSYHGQNIFDLESAKIVEENREHVIRLGVILDEKIRRQRIRDRQREDVDYSLELADIYDAIYRASLDLDLFERLPLPVEKEDGEFRFVETAPYDIILENSESTDEFQRLIMSDGIQAQFGIPTETAKNLLREELIGGRDVPLIFVLPPDLFRQNRNWADIEFVFYYNYYIKQGRKITLVGDREQIENMKLYIQNSLLGPDLEAQDYLFPGDQPGVFRQGGLKEAEKLIYRSSRDKFVDRNKTTGEPLQLEDRINFVSFDPQTNKAVTQATSKSGKSATITIQRGPFASYLVTEKINGHINRYPPVQVDYREPKFELPGRLPVSRQDDISSVTMHPLAITTLGNAHGFAGGNVTIATDDKGAPVTIPEDYSNFMITIGGGNYLVDPSPQAVNYLNRYGLMRMIQGVILTHTHADHDGGILRQILQNERITVITSPAAYKSYVEKSWVLVSDKMNISLEDWRKRMNDPQKMWSNLILVEPGKDIELPTLNGDTATLRVRWNIHPIPTMGLKVTYRGKTIGISGDTLYDEAEISKLLAEQKITQEQADDLLYFFWDKEGRLLVDRLYHEAGIPPLHTPGKNIQAVFEKVSGLAPITYLYHIAAKDVPQGLKHAPLLKPDIVIPKNAESMGNYVKRTLDRIPDLANLTAGEKDLLLMNGEKRTYKSEEVIFAEGDEGDYYYLILSGTGEIVKGGQRVNDARHGDRIDGGTVVATLSSGWATGEIALEPLPEGAQPDPNRGKRTAAFRVAKGSHLQVLRISQSDYLEIIYSKIKERQDIKPIVYLLNDAIRKIFGVDIARDKLDYIARKVRVRNFAPGDILMNEGETGDTALVIPDADLKITSSRGFYKKLREDYAVIGEIALDKEGVRTATVVTHKEIPFAVELSKQLFDLLLYVYPGIDVSVKEMVERRAAELANGRSTITTPNARSEVRSAISGTGRVAEPRIKKAETALRHAAKKSGISKELVDLALKNGGLAGLSKLISAKGNEEGNPGVSDKTLRRVDGIMSRSYARSEVRDSKTTDHGPQTIDLKPKTQIARNFSARSELRAANWIKLSTAPEKHLRLASYEEGLKLLRGLLTEGVEYALNVEKGIPEAQGEAMIIIRFLREKLQIHSNFLEGWRPQWNRQDEDFFVIRPDGRVLLVSLPKAELNEESINQIPVVSADELLAKEPRSEIRTNRRDFLKDLAAGVFLLPGLLKAQLSEPAPFKEGLTIIPDHGKKQVTIVINLTKPGKYQIFTRSIFDPNEASAKFGPEIVVTSDQPIQGVISEPTDGFSKYWILVPVRDVPAAPAAPAPANLDGWKKIPGAMFGAEAAKYLSQNRRHLVPLSTPSYEPSAISQEPKSRSEVRGDSLLRSVENKRSASVRNYAVSWLLVWAILTSTLAAAFLDSFAGYHSLVTGCLLLSSVFTAALADHLDYDAPLFKGFWMVLSPILIFANYAVWSHFSGSFQISPEYRAAFSMGNFVFLMVQLHVLLGMDYKEPGADRIQVNRGAVSTSPITLSSQSPSNESARRSEQRNKNANDRVWNFSMFALKFGISVIPTIWIWDKVSGYQQAKASPVLAGELWMFMTLGLIVAAPVGLAVYWLIATPLANIAHHIVHYRGSNRRVFHLRKLLSSSPKRFSGRSEVRMPDQTEGPDIREWMSKHNPNEVVTVDLQPKGGLNKSLRNLLKAKEAGLKARAEVDRAAGPQDPNARSEVRTVSSMVIETAREIVAALKPNALLPRQEIDNLTQAAARVSQTHSGIAGLESAAMRILEAQVLAQADSVAVQGLTEITNITESHQIQFVLYDSNVEPLVRSALGLVRANKLWSVSLAIDPSMNSKLKSELSDILKRLDINPAQHSAKKQSTKDGAGIQIFSAEYSEAPRVGNVRTIVVAAPTHLTDALKFDSVNYAEGGTLDRSRPELSSELVIGAAAALTQKSLSWLAQRDHRFLARNEQAFRGGVEVLTAMLLASVQATSQSA